MLLIPLCIDWFRLNSSLGYLHQVWVWPTAPAMASRLSFGGADFSHRTGSVLVQMVHQSVCVLVADHTRTAESL